MQFNVLLANKLFCLFLLGVCTCKPPEEVPETVTSDTALSTVKDVPLELQATSEADKEAASSSAADQESQEIDIEGTGESVGLLGEDIPMELTTPLSSGSELNLSFDSELVEEKDHQDKITDSSEVATIKPDDETMDVDVVGEEGAATSSTTPRTERVDSVQIDPSFKPESEELLYEGDLENDGEEHKSVPQEGQSSTAAASASTAATTHEEGFVLAVDDTFADLDVAPSAGGKSPPKKQELSSKPKSEKSSSKSQSTSQSSKAKTDVSGSGSSSTTTATTTPSSSKHSTKDSGKATSSGSTESAPSSRFVYCWTLHLLLSSRFTCHS